MRGWTHVRLGEVLTQCIDRHPVEAGRLYPNIGIYGFGRGVFVKEPINGGSFGADSLYRLRAGQFTYSRLKAFEGAYGLVPDFGDGAYVTNEFPAFDIDADSVLPQFLCWYFRRSATWEQLARQSTGLGARRERLHPRALLAETLPLPPLPEQERIVGKIEAAATRLDEARRLRQEIQNDGKTLLHSVFHRLIQDATYHPLAEVAPIFRRPVQVDLDAAYPELGVRSFGKGTFHKPLLAGSDVGNKKLFHIEPGDLVFSNVFAWEGAIAVAKRDDLGRVGSHRFIACVPRLDLATPDFLCFYFLTDHGMEQVRDASPGGAGRNRTLGLSKLEQIRVPLPTIEKQQEFSVLQAKIAAIHQAQAANRSEIDALLPAVLDKAFKGEL